MKHSKTLSLKVGVSEILDILLEYFDTKDHLQRFTNKNSYLIGDVVKIIEIILFNGNDSTALGIKNMVACLYHKPNTEI